MFALTPVRTFQFDILIGRSGGTRKMMKHRGTLKPLIVPKPKQRADGLWRPQILLAADAVILTATDLLFAAGATRATLTFALTDIQLAIINVLTDLDDGKNVELTFAHDGKHYAVFTDTDVTAAFLRAIAYFKARGVTHANQLAIYSVPLRTAYDQVRARAARAGIEYPERVWLTPDELDQACDLVATAIDPNTSPIITRWQEARAAEVHAAEHRAGGRLS